MSADQKIAETLSRYGEPFQDSIWRVQGQAVIFHRTLERIAAQARIAFDLPTIVRAEADEAVVLVAGRLGERMEWSIGEAKINLNYKVSGRQAAYPFAMAEKRGKDRVILKLIELHGLVYSEEEADDFRDEIRRQRAQERLSQRQANRPPGQEPPPDRFEPREEVMSRAINGNGAVQMGDGEVTREAALRRKVESSSIGRKLAAAKTVDNVAAVMNNPLVIKHVEGLHPDLRDAVEAFAQERHRDVSLAAKQNGGGGGAEHSQEDGTAEQPFDGEARLVEVGEAYLLARSEQDIEEVRATWVEDNDRFSMSQRERVEDLDAKACRRIAERKPAATDPFCIPERFDGEADYRVQLSAAIAVTGSAEEAEKLRSLWNGTKAHRKALSLVPEVTNSLKAEVARTLERFGVSSKAYAKAEAAHVA